jgi:hypothetical protein
MYPVTIAPLSGHQQLDRSGLALLGPQPHRNRGHEEQIQPRQIVEERREVRLAADVEAADAESQRADEHQEDHDEHQRQRCGEVAGEFAAEQDQRRSN